MHGCQPRRDPVRIGVLAFLLTVIMAFGLTACLSDEGAAARPGSRLSRSVAKTAL